MRSRFTKSQRRGIRWKQSWYSPERTTKWVKVCTSLPKGRVSPGGCGGWQLRWAQKGTRQFPDSRPISRHHRELAGMYPPIPIIPFLWLLGAHKGPKPQGSQRHLLLGEIPPSHPGGMLQCCLHASGDTAVPWLSGDSPSTGNKPQLPATLVRLSMQTSACRLWKVPALLRSYLGI